MSKHTPEPWYVVGPLSDEESGTPGGTFPQIGVPSDEVGAPIILAEVYEKADQERIVDCVNACAGMTDPAAEIAALREAVRVLGRELSEKAMDQIGDSVLNNPLAAAAVRGEQ